MGNRYFITIKCPRCDHVDDNVYYAPTCGIVYHTCQCGYVTDLETMTGIFHEEASNKGQIEKICKKVKEDDKQ